MLPKIDVPIYQITLPLSKTKISFRPFLVKEEKILMMAIESDEENAMLLAIKQVVNNCVVDTLDVDSLPMTDLEFIFLNLRARSVNEIVELQYKCNNNVGAEGALSHKCGTLVKFNINLLDIKPEIPKDHTTKIQLSDDIGCMMKYPNFKMYEDLDASKSEMDKIIEITLKSIDYIYDKDSIYYTKDISHDELVEYIEGLTQDQFKKIQGFLKTIPKIKVNINFKCPKCQYEENIDVEGIQNFLS